TVKYSSAGVPLWTNRYRGPGVGAALAPTVVVDGSNSVIVAGTGATPSVYFNYATVKYSSEGLPLWTNLYHGPGEVDDEASAVAVDSSNNVVVTGYSWDWTTPDYATIKYSSAGAGLWTNRYNGPGNGDDYATALAVDGSNNVIVTGYSRDNVSGYDYATIKYSSAGVPLWTNRYNTPGNGDDYATALALDGSNNVIVAGYSTNNVNGYDYFTIKYSSTGLPLWTNHYAGPGGSSGKTCVLAVDSGGNLILTAHAVGSRTNADYLTIKYSSQGEPLWTNYYNGPGNSYDRACAVAVDSGGQVIVTGYSIGAASGFDFATVKYICVPSPMLTALQLTNGTFQMRVDDVLQPGTLVIEACTNLAGWEAIFTNTTPTNVLFYADPDAGSLPARFYRAFQFP
ncbi:MAG: hypothetical protein LUO89_08480, partial [Methanothrix sp.]|nr:hypothetical protein [Methanothrix sp.]